LPNTKCFYCCFFETCNGVGGGSRICEHYYPIGEPAEQEWIDSEIERGRAEFRAEYFEYMESFYD
jgi:hypothetical protein